MAIKFNPLLFSGLQFDTSGGGVTSWKAPVATEASLPLVGNLDGDTRVALDTDFIWIWDNTAARWLSTGIKQANVGAVPNSQGYSVESVNVGLNRTERQLTLQPADATNPGIITTGAQTIAGDKTFNDDVVVQGDFTVNGTETIINTEYLNVEDKNITVNVNGTTAMTVGSGINIEGDAAAVVGYFRVDEADNSLLEFKAPGNAAVLKLDINASETITVAGSLDIEADSAINQDLTTDASPEFAGLLVNGEIQTSEQAILVNVGGTTVGSTSSGINIEGDAAAVVGYMRVDSADNSLFEFKSPGNASVLKLDINASETLTIAGSLDVEADSAINQDLTTDASPEFGGLLVSGDLDVTGTTTLDTALTGPVKATTGVISASAIDLTSEVTGVLPPANGGTGSSTDVAPGSWLGLANNTADQDITGFTVPTASVGGFDGIVRVQVDATADLYAVYKIIGVQKAASAWELIVNSVGDSIPGVDFTALDTAGTTQVRISVGNMAGFTSASVKFRAITVGI